MKNWPRSLVQKIEERKQQNAFRELVDFSGYTDFFSNDYLGLAKWRSEHQECLGATGSRLISGNLKRTEEIEAELAVFFGAESGLIFNSGYDANIGLFSSVLQKGDTVIYDQHIHASIRDGIRLSNASSFSFAHNDLHSLRERVSRAKGEKYVVVESIYSMDGDAAPLNEMSKLCQQENAWLIVDEAHSGGIHGKNGQGCVCELGLDDKIFAKIMTFGKAYGSHGAIVLGNKDLRDYLINFARSFIYTTALSPHAQERILQAVNKAAGLDKERTHLENMIGRFKGAFASSPFKMIESHSPIQSMVVPGNENAKALAQQLIDQRIAVKAILSPTVPAGSERLRFCLHSYNTSKEIEKLAEIIHA